MTKLEKLELKKEKKLLALKKLGEKIKSLKGGKSTDELTAEETKKLAELRAKEELSEDEEKELNTLIDKALNTKDISEEEKLTNEVKELEELEAAARAEIKELEDVIRGGKQKHQTKEIDKNIVANVKNLLGRK